MSGPFGIRTPTPAYYKETIIDHKGKKIDRVVGFQVGVKPVTLANPEQPNISSIAQDIFHPPTPAAVRAKRSITPQVAKFRPVERKSEEEIAIDGNPINPASAKSEENHLVFAFSASFIPQILGINSNK